MENKKLKLKLTKTESLFLSEYRKLDSEHKSALLELMKFYLLEQQKNRKMLS